MLNWKLRTCQSLKTIYSMDTKVFETVYLSLRTATKDDLGNN